MASPASPEASDIRRRGRQRLIGAIALVMLLVVFVPMVLDPEPSPTRPEPSLAIPPRDKVAPLPPVPVEPPPAAPQPAAPVAAKPPPAQPAAKAPAAAVAKPAGFAVQVGAFRDEALLFQAREKLAATGVAHYTERLDAQGGGLTRLRAGPFPTREAAEAALAKIKLGALDGNVVALP